MSTGESRRWNGFVCPNCRAIFRVRSDHDGRGVVCATCRSILQLPQDAESAPPLVFPEAARRRRRRGESQREKKVFDETFANKTEADPIFGRIMIALAVTLFLVVGVGLVWRQIFTTPETTTSAPPAFADESAAEPTQAPAEPLRFKDEVATVQLVRDELLPVTEKFLTAKDLADAAQWTHQPEQTLTRMREFHADSYSPPGLKTVLWNTPMTRGLSWASFQIETAKFRNRRVFLIETPDGWRLDWESFVGWSPISWDQLKASQPVETIRVRATVRPVKYYNFRFSSEAEWAAVSLISPVDQSVIYGYARRDSEAYQRLPFRQEEGEEDLLLDIRYPKNSPTDNQVLIEAVTGKHWLDTESLGES